MSLLIGVSGQGLAGKAHKEALRGSHDVTCLDRDLGYNVCCYHKSYGLVCLRFMHFTVHESYL